MSNPFQPTKLAVRAGAVVGLVVCALAGAAYAGIKAAVCFATGYDFKHATAVGAAIKRGVLECAEMLGTGRVLYAARNQAAENGMLRPIIKRLTASRVTGCWW